MSEHGPTVLGGRYELHRRLARGGMADVFLGRDQLLDRPVAVKVLFPEFATDPAAVERFRREATAAANLSHPNIVGIYDWGSQGSTYYLVMEYVEGRSLAEVLRAEGPLHPDRAATIAFDVAAALGFAHRSGIAHRDVKPGNVLISPTGQVKVGDLGIATAIARSAESNLTQAGSVMGTATYFSPEQAQGKPVDPRSDLYSLGVVLYEMLGGRPPFSGDSPVAVAYKHVQEPPQSLTARGARVPQSLEAITMKLLAKEPGRRYPTAEDLQADLRRYLDGQHDLGPAVVAPAAAPPPSAPPTGTVAPVGPAADATNALRSEQLAAYRANQAPAYRPDPRGGGYDDGYYDDYYDDRGPNRTWFYAAGFVVLVAVLIGLILLLLNTLSKGDDVVMITVPDVVGDDADDAERLLIDRGFDVRQETEADDVVEPGKVIRTDPTEGTELEEGSLVTLFVSAGPEPLSVPNVVGDDVAAAEQELRTAGFEVVVEPEESDEVLEDRVIRQDPAGGAELERGGTVTLFVSAGPETIQVPDVTELSVVDATQTLTDLGFRVSQSEEPSDDVPLGSIIRTDPEVGADAKKGETITLVLSSGPEKQVVPNVLGSDQTSATTALQNAGFTVVPDTCLITNPATQTPGTVISQTPPPGTEVDPGSVVNICVGVEPEPTPTPEVPTPTPEVPTPTPTTAPPTPTP
ncbi:MAG: Stk1 family PASTA domain-containing Ser/Thr kinase [Acidimicrobiales bacterium]|nr:Stk1 family PASTA domain-containing Ser/Thr kinase [Acidimicrobiales bacterium]